MRKLQKNSDILPAMSYKRRVIVLIVILSFVRLFISSIIDLGNDESYYWLYSQYLKWNYFDHPPMVSLWIRIFTLNLWLDDHELFLRLGSVTGCAISSWFMYKCVSTLHSERAGWFAALLYNASFYSSITAGLLIMPDSPQMVFWTLSLWMIARIMADEKNWFNWLLLGIASGLCIMSKMHGVFIWSGILLYAVSVKRSWLNQRLFASLSLTMIIASPIVIWNVENNFVTYHFHIQRITPQVLSLSHFNLLRELIGQILINNIFNVAIIIIALSASLNKKNPVQRSLAAYNFIALPLIFSLLVISFYKHTFPHWSGPGYITLIPIAAIYLAVTNSTIYFPRILKYSMGLYLISLFVCSLVVKYYPGNFGNNERNDLGKGDITLDMNGWREAGEQFAKIYNQEILDGKALPASPVVCYNWWGSHIEYYFCRPGKIRMIGLGSLNDLHQYAWLNTPRIPLVNFNTAYCVVPSDENYNVQDEYRDFYSYSDMIAIIHVQRNKIPTHDFYVYRLTGWKNKLPLKK
ncbi:MAG: glycosyltransferase family 39 protein [Ginsengibacter sp.]